MEAQKLSNTKETIAFLAQKFPQCFTVDGDVKPLKIGIFQDLSEALKDDESISNRMLRISLRHYTSSWKYLASVKEGVARVDLDGNGGEVINAEHAEHAAQALKESKQKAAEKRQAEKASKKSDNSNKERRGPSKTANKKFASKSFSSKPKALPRNDKPAMKAMKISDEELSTGLQVSVKVGKQPMPAVITELGKDGIFVQLNSGMTVKVQREQLRVLVKQNEKG